MLTGFDYINRYQSNARDDRIHRFAVAIEVDESLLRAFLQRNVTEDNINEFGLFDQLKATVNLQVARAYFEKIEGQPVKKFRVKAKVDTLLRKFVLSGHYEQFLTPREGAAPIDKKLRKEI